MTMKLFVKSPSLSPPIPSAFTPYPLFQWYPQNKETWLNLSMKCWYSAFNAQGSRVIIIVVQVGAVKIYVAIVEALGKKERGDETQFTNKTNWWEK
jgi:nicotinamide riboside transporter PnuC